jgi:hypothetical protein
MDSSLHRPTHVNLWISIKGFPDSTLPLGEPDPKLGSPDPTPGEPDPKLGEPDPTLGEPDPKLGSPDTNLGEPDPKLRDAIDESDEWPTDSTPATSLLSADSASLASSKSSSLILLPATTKGDMLDE